MQTFNVLCLCLVLCGWLVSLVCCQPVEPSPPTSGVLTYLNARLHVDGTTIDTVQTYLMMSPRLWMVQIPKSGPKAGQFQAIYTVLNVSYPTSQLAQSVHIDSFGLFVNGTCITESQDATPTQDTYVDPATAKNTAFTGNSKQTPYYIGITPCDSFIAPGQTCRTWVTNTTHYIRGTATSVEYQMDYWPASGDLGVMSLGQTAGFYPGPFGSTGYVDPKAQVFTQVQYWPSNDQAQSQLPNNAYILPDACKTAAARNGIQIPGNAFSNAASATSSACITIIMVLEAAVLALFML